MSRNIKLARTFIGHQAWKKGQGHLRTALPCFSQGSTSSAACNESSAAHHAQHAVRVRGFATSTANGAPDDSLMEESLYHEVSDATLDAISDYLSELEDTTEEMDMNCSQGVLNISLGPSIGHWVINKQTPNRQLWWSSPMSGPRRYEYDSSMVIDEDLDNLCSWKYIYKSGDERHEAGADSIDLLTSINVEIMKATQIS